MELKGTAGIVTGASSDDGIGSECAKILASRGCNVVVNYATNKAGADKVVAACKAAGADAIAVQGDVSKDDDCKRLVQACLDKWGRLDVLVNNAATTKPIPHRRMDLLDATEFERIFAVNVIGNYQMTRAAAPHLKASGDAAIVNISSVGAMRAGRQLDGLHGFERRAQQPDAVDGARAGAGGAGQCAVPGRDARRLDAQDPHREAVSGAARQAKTEYPLHRGIWPRDVAVAALFLVEGATTMTGECIRMDCGQHLGETNVQAAAQRRDVPSDSA